MKDNQNPTILLVDDEPVNCALLEKTLRKEGYRTINANNGPQARRLALKKRPDIILLDITMDGEDGFEVISILKKNPKTANIPVVFLTGRDELEAKIKGFELGAVDYITKPFQSQEVLARVRQHLRLSLVNKAIIESQAERLKQISDAQASLLIRPKDLPDAGFSVYYKALLEAGGDFYDVVKISEGIFGFFVADFSGHDNGTGQITSALKALIKQNCVPIFQPAESMMIINNVLKEILPEEKYLTACYAKLNRKTRRMSIINGGHPPVVHIPKEGRVRLIEAKGDVIGIFGEVYFETLDIEVNSGDRFFLYSDGLVEKPGSKKAWINELEHLMKMCDQLRDVKFHESAKLLMEMLHGRKPRPEDDIVVLGIEV